MVHLSKANIKTNNSFTLSQFNESGVTTSVTGSAVAPVQRPEVAPPHIAGHGGGLPACVIVAGKFPEHFLKHVNTTEPSLALTALPTDGEAPIELLLTSATPSL